MKKKKGGAKPVKVESNRGDGEGCDHLPVQNKGVEAHATGEEVAGDEQHDGDDRLR